MSESAHRWSPPVLAGLLLLAAACGQAPASENETRARGSQSSTEDVVASVGEREIRLSDVDEKALQSNMNAYQELYNVRRQALEELIADILLEQEASRRDVSAEDLVAEEITSKIEPVDSDDVEAFFEQNRARLGGRTLEQIGPQIRQYLESQRESAARQSFLSELKEKSDVAIHLDPPRVPVQVASHEPVKGPADAPVTIVEYSDFQ